MINNLIKNFIKMFDDKENARFENVVNSVITINGKTYTGNANSKIKVTIDNETVGIFNSDEKINITVNGDVREIETIAGNVNITGSVFNVKSTSGNVKAEGNIYGDVKTVSGDVKATEINCDNIKTVSGNIKTK